MEYRQCELTINVLTLLVKSGHYYVAQPQTPPPPHTHTAELMDVPLVPVGDCNVAESTQKGQQQYRGGWWGGLVEVKFRSASTDSRGQL